MTGLCAVCDVAPPAEDDIMCSECRTYVNSTLDEITDPVESVLNKHQHFCALSDMDRTMCRCGEQFEGGPAIHRRHLATKIYEALDLPGPTPWILGPNSPIRQSHPEFGEA